MSIVNRVMAMKAKPNKQEVKPETQSSHDKTTKVKQEKEKQKQLTPAQLAAIAAVSGQAEADRLKALLGSGVKPEAVKHLSDVNAPALATLASNLPPEYLLVGELIKANPDEKPKRKELEASIAEWALANPKVMK